MTYNLIFTSGSTDNDVRCVDYGIMDDSALEGNQTFTVALTTSDSDVMLGIDISTVTIIDNDGQCIETISSINVTCVDIMCISTDVHVSVESMLSVGEGDGMVRVCATLSALEDTERNVTISLTTSDGTGILNVKGVLNYSPHRIAAMVVDDYIRFSSNNTFSSGSIDNDTRCVDVSIVDDDVLEGNQNFIVTLTTPDPNVILGNEMTTVAIIDNDGLLFLME